MLRSISRLVTFKNIWISPFISRNCGVCSCIQEKVSRQLKGGNCSEKIGYERTLVETCFTLRIFFRRSCRKTLFRTRKPKGGEKNTLTVFERFGMVELVKVKFPKFVTPLSFHFTDFPFHRLHPTYASKLGWESQTVKKETVKGEMHRLYRLGFWLERWLAGGKWRFSTLRICLFAAWTWFLLPIKNFDKKLNPEPH